MTYDKLDLARKAVPALVLALASPAQGQDVCPDPADMAPALDGSLADVRYLADDALAGREVGSPGALCAARFIEGRFRDLGLRPVNGEKYFQEFTVTTGAELGHDNRLRVAGETYTLGEDWIPFGFSGSGEVEGSLLYGGLGMRGTVLVVDAVDPASPDDAAMESDPRFLASAAVRHGTAAVLVMLADGQDLPEPARESRPAVPIPVVAVAGDARVAIREAAGHNRTLQLITDVEVSRRRARNVMGLLEGADATLRNEVVVVGAHFDHLGLGGDGSLASEQAGTIHNGADDNASGTAALLDVAARLATSPNRPARSVLFLAFTGEERGLWGSAQYVKEPALPLENTVAMLNLDMVGRLEDGSLTVFGMATAQEWEEIVGTANEGLTEPMTLSLLPDGFGPSDHSSFYGEGVPVLHFFTNAHEDYHRPSDDWERIDADGLVRVADLVSAVVWRVAGTGPEAVALTPVEGAGNPHGGDLPSGDQSSASSGYGPYLGTIPDMTPQESGVRLTGVRDGSPAEVAGIRTGDVIVEFEGREIGDLYAYTYALREHSPGDEVHIVVLRDGERVEVVAVLGQRR